VVGPPQGLREAVPAADGLALRLDDGHGNLGLRLSGRLIDPQALPRLELSYRSEQPLLLQFAAAADFRPQLQGGPTIELPAGSHTETWPLHTLLPPASQQPLAQLRLWLHGVPGQRLLLRQLRLLPAECAPPCLPPRLHLDPWLTGARALAARDQVHALQPQSLIGAPAPPLLIQSAAWLQSLGTLPMGLLGLLTVLAGAALRLLSRPRLHSALALLLGAALPIALLALGLPRFPAQLGDALLLAALALSLWLARPRGVAVPTAPAHQAWKQAAAFTAIGLLGLLLVAALSESAPSWPSAERLLRYALFATLQQLWLARFALPHLQRLGLGAWAIPAAALLFAGLHLPNLELMALTAAAGLIWAALALRHGRLWPQVLSHIALGLAAVALLPPELLRSAEVGGRFVLTPL
jgi:membrane protease YdiL (CAAX protease family)